MEKKWQVFILVAVSVFMSTLDGSIVNLALPYIMTGLSCNMGSVQWVVTVYLLVVSSLLLAFGRVSDIFGRSRVYQAGFAVFIMGSLFCGMSGRLELLVVSRAIQGIGAAMLMACSPAMIVDVFEPESRGKALGLVGACVASGLTLGPVTGGVLLEYFSWPVIFFINIPVGGAALILSGFVLDGRRVQSRETMDFGGMVLIIILVTALVLGLVRAPAWGFFSFRELVSLLVCLMALAGLWANGRRVAHPLVDPALFRIRLFVFALLGAVFLFAALFTLIFIMPFYLSLVCGFSPGLTGIAMIVPFLVLLVVAPVSGSAADRLGAGKLCLAGMGCLALALLSTAALKATPDLTAIFWRLALAGLGTALFVSPNNMSLMGAVPPERRGIASGAVATARNLGMVMGVALASGIFSHTFSVMTQGQGLDLYRPDMAPFFMTAFRYVMVAGAMTAMLGMGSVMAWGPES